MNMPKEWNAAQLLELSGSHWPSCALQAAVELGVFTSLADQALTTGDLAGHLGCDRRALGMLLDALVAMRLLRRAGDAYANTAAARRLLAADSAEYLGNIIRHHYHLLEAWSRLDRGVKTGRPPRERASWSEEEWLESFLRGMADLVRQIAPQIVPAVDLADRRQLLDLGGGPGSWAAYFCRQNPLLRATVVDLPTTRPIAEENIAAFGLSDRIDFQGADFLAEDIPGHYDVAWLSQILHGEGPQECRAIVGKAAAALEPGGILMIHEFILDDDRSGPVFPALFSLNMLLQTQRGQSYTEGDLAEMLRQAGFSQVRRLPLPAHLQSGILAARR